MQAQGFIVAGASKVAPSRRRNTFDVVAALLLPLLASCFRLVLRLPLSNMPVSAVRRARRHRDIISTFCDEGTGEKAESDDTGWERIPSDDTKLQAMLRFIVLAVTLAATSGIRLGTPVSSRALPARAVRVPLVTLEATKEEAAEEEEDRLGAGGKGGHAVKNMPELSEKEKEIQKKVMEHQQTAARLTGAEETRSLVEYSTGYAVLSTISKDLEGYPGGAVVGFAPDAQGLPVFCFSAMSGHTKDLLAAPSGAPAALTVTANGFQGAADARVTLVGDVKRCSKEESVELREVYKAAPERLLG